MQSTTFPGTTPGISRSYDPNGNLLTVNRGGANWSYSYNNINLISSETLALDGRTYQTSYGYNGNAALTSQAFPSGQNYGYGVDGYGRLTSITSGATSYIENVSYFPNGKISQLTRGNGGTFQQSLNSRQLVSTVGGNWGTSFSYAYDLNGRVSQITSPNSIYNRTFGYDGAGRLTSASGVWGSGSYTYDALNNMTRAVLGSRIIDLQFNSINQVSNVRDSAASSNWRAYSYDARGNVIGDGKHNFNYDSANQPISISGNDTGNYTYDGNLKRVKESVGGQTIYSVYSRSGALLTRDNVSNGKKTDYLAVSGQTFVRNNNGVPEYPLNDALGTAYMVADANGNLTATYNYTPFGESLGTGPGASGEQGYTGHIEDKTGLTYMKARYFDPIIGRFLSPDPIGYRDQLNLYSYVGNDPLNSIDPTGEAEYRLMYGEPGLNEHNVGRNFQRAAETRANELREAGHTVTVAAVATVDDVAKAINSGSKVDGGIELFMHGGLGMVSPGEGSGAETNITAANIGNLSSANVSPTAKGALNACFSALGGLATPPDEADAPIAQQMADQLGIPFTGMADGTSFTNDKSKPLTGEGERPSEKGPLYMRPQHLEDIKTFQPR